VKDRIAAGGSMNRRRTRRICALCGQVFP
jgi:hypothetical protein